MALVGATIDEPGTLLCEDGTFLLRRDLGGRWRLDMRRIEAGPVERRVRISSVMAAYGLVEVAGIAPAAWSAAIICEPIAFSASERPLASPGKPVTALLSDGKELRHAHTSHCSSCRKRLRPRSCSGNAGRSRIAADCLCFGKSAGAEPDRSAAWKLVDGSTRPSNGLDGLTEDQPSLRQRSGRNKGGSGHRVRSGSTTAFVSGSQRAERPN